MAFSCESSSIGSGSEEASSCGVSDKVPSTKPDEVACSNFLRDSTDDGLGVILSVGVGFVVGFGVVELVGMGVEGGTGVGVGDGIGVGVAKLI